MREIIYFTEKKERNSKEKFAQSNALFSKAMPARGRGRNTEIMAIQIMSYMPTGEMSWMKVYLRNASSGDMVVYELILLK